MVNENLPEGWTVVTIGEIAESINPGFASGQHNQENVGVPHIRPMNISRIGEIDLSVVKSVEPKDYFPLLRCDVLFNNTNSPELVGKTTYIRQNTNWAYSNHMTRIRLRQDVAFSGWVANALHYLFLDGYFKLNCRHHVNQASVSSGYLSQNIRIPLPPLPEQERIVAKIEELFTQLEAGVAALKRVRAGLKRYKASVLKAAVEGRLFDVGAHGMRPALNGESDGRGEGRTPSALTDDGRLPDGWRWATVEDLAADEKYSLAIGPFGSNLKVIDYRNEGVPLVFVRNIKAASFDKTHYITREKAEELKAHQIAGGDILITKMGEPPGDACLYPDTGPNAVITADCIKWRVSETLADKRYITHAINSSIMQKQIQKITRGVAQKKVSLDRFRGLSIPLPPLAEQRRIVAEVERRLSVAAAVESVLAASVARAARLRQSVLKAAFEGKMI